MPEEVEIMTRITCPSCQGSGKGGNGKSACENCHGAGKIQQGLSLKELAERVQKELHRQPPSNTS